MRSKLLDRDLETADPLLHSLVELERERQERKIILIASESMAPQAVRETLASDFGHIYAEGYPSGLLSRSSQHELADFAEQLAYLRRYSDPRYYKGCEYADLMEALAKRRAAEAFATAETPAEHIFANVQPLSGAASNNAVYEAFLEPGDRVLGLTLAHGGHLTHGSPVNRSGKRYEILSYEVHAKGHLDYDRIEQYAIECRPRLIIAGFSAYPWDLDWPRFRRIADAVPGGAVLLADIAHTAGLVAAGVVNNPVGHTDVVSFTTHKSLCGPRGATLLSTDPAVARRLNMAVFPGEQGGPHLHSMAAKAVAFGLAAKDEFKQLMQGVLDNAQALAKSCVEAGLTLAYGGTDTHMVLLDLRGLTHRSGYRLTGEVASQLLDLAHITCNKNTIRGDTNAAHPSAIRMGTVWATQRGFTPAHMPRLAGLVARVLQGIEPFEYLGGAAPQGRGKVPAGLLAEIRGEVAALLDDVEQGITTDTGYPHFHASRSEREAPLVLKVRGRRAGHLLHDVCTADILTLRPGESTPTLLLDTDGRCLADGVVVRLDNPTRRRTRFLLRARAADPVLLLDWLRELSDGYVRSADDLFAKAAGPAVIHDLALEEPQGLAALEQANLVPELPTGDPPLGADAAAVYALLNSARTDVGRLDKAFFVGQKAVLAAAPAAAVAAAAHDTFSPPPVEAEPRETCLYAEHLKLTTKHAMAPFAGWTMPMRYAGPAEEHRAVREGAGLFDVSHMGVLEVTGPHAERFLNLVTTNYVPALYDGKAQYSYLLAPDGRVIDDILVYRHGFTQYMIVVNAANAAEDEAWLRALNETRVLIDPDQPHRTLEGSVTIRNLKDPAQAGADQRVDLALQGPGALPTLALAADDPVLYRSIAHLKPFEFCTGSLLGGDAIISRTGYTGAPVGFELYVHPDRAPAIWSRLLELGEPFGVQPAGLAARDSTRTEAGLPLHGHELAGSYNVSPIEAGYGGFVKLHKPFFVGRAECVNQARNRQRTIVAFELEDTKGRVPRTGAPVVDAASGRYAGVVTSIAGVSERQFGLALVEARLAEEGTRLAVFPAAATPRKPAKWPAEIGPGDQVQLARTAVVLPRFPLSRRAAMEEEAE